jgi:hypothetical protein
MMMWSESGSGRGPNKSNTQSQNLPKVDEKTHEKF